MARPTTLAEALKCIDALKAESELLRCALTRVRAERDAANHRAHVLAKEIEALLREIQGGFTRT